MGVVHAEDAHALLDQEADDALELLPEGSPRRRIKVKGIDVLIFFGRVFRVLHGAIGALLEPLRVLLHIGMVRGTLESDVEGYLYPILLGLREQAPEIVQGPELWMDGHMPAGSRPNGPGTAWAIRSSHGGIVLALAVDLANGMNGRKIEDVKPHTRHIRETCLAILEGPVLARHQGRGTGPAPFLVRLGGPLAAGSKRRRYVPARSSKDGTTRVATPLAFQGSGDVFGFAKADVLVTVPEGAAARAAGDTAEALELFEAAP